MTVVGDCQNHASIGVQTERPLASAHEDHGDLLEALNKYLQLPEPKHDGPRNAATSQSSSGAKDEVSRVFDECAWITFVHVYVCM